MAEPPTLYDLWFKALTGQGASPEQAVITVVHRYLDGKSGTKNSQAEIDAAFWSSVSCLSSPDEMFRTEGFVLPQPPTGSDPCPKARWAVGLSAG